MHSCNAKWRATVLGEVYSYCPRCRKIRRGKSFQRQPFNLFLVPGQETILRMHPVKVIMEEENEQQTDLVSS